MRFSKKIIVTMFLSVFVFVVTMIVVYWFKGGIPDTLVDRFFAFFGIEGGALGIIKVAETFAEKNAAKSAKNTSKKRKTED